MPKKKRSEEAEPSLYLDKYQLDRLHEYAYGLEGLANITKCDEHENIGYLVDIVCDAILELSAEIGKQKLEDRGGGE